MFAATGKETHNTPLWNGITCRTVSGRCQTLDVFIFNTSSLDLFYFMALSWRMSDKNNIYICIVIIYLKTCLYIYSVDMQSWNNGRSTSMLNLQMSLKRFFFLYLILKMAKAHVSHKNQIVSAKRKILKKHYCNGILTTLFLGCLVR